MAPCGACVYRKLKCKSDCPFAPYFSYPGSINDYGTIHRYLGHKSFLRAIKKLPIEQRQQAISSLLFESICKDKNPVLGCVNYLCSLEQQILELKEQVETIDAYLQKKDLEETTDPNFQSNETDTNWIDLTISNPTSPLPASPEFSNSTEIFRLPRIHSPTLRCLVSPKSHPSHWTNLVQHFRFLDSQSKLEPTESPKIHSCHKCISLQPSSSKSPQNPTPATDPYFFFNTKHLRDTQKISMKF